MGILDDDVAAVRAASDIVGIVGQYLQLRRVGRRWVGLCPFHAERTPSFSVNAEEGLYYCLAGETRVITWDGVKPIRELAGTTAKVLTEKGRWVEAPFRSFGVQPLMQLTLTRNRQRKVIHATPEHRWYVRGKGTHRYERTTAELRPGHGLAWSFPANRTRLLGDVSPFGVAHGITYGDGTLFGHDACVDLHGEKDAELLKWFPLNRTLTCLQADGTSYTKVMDLPRYFKARPSLDESPQYLAGWLAGYLAADGHVANDGTCCISSADRSSLELVRDVCTRLGIGTYGITTQRREGFSGREPSELHRVHLITEDLDERFFLVAEHRRRFAGARKAWVRRGWIVESVEPTDRVEEVFCAQVEGTHNFVLEDNILTGNCFGCQARGDVITFVREVEHLDFVGAVEWLAGRCGVTLRYTDRNESEGRRKRARLVETMARAVDWYHQRLLSGADAGAARRYLRERGLDGDVVREYRIGWAPDGWDELCRALSLGENEARDTGLGFRNARNRLQDSFRARVMFPIFDAQGDPVSFGGRILPGADDPRNHGKYKNTPETALYHKSKVLYGLDRAKGAIVSSDTAVVCEGYTDVIGFHRNGVPSAVATCGTALTDEHVTLLRRYARKLVLAFDADGAGQAAAERFYQWERDHDLEVAVADLPVGQDPADLARSDPSRLAAAVEGATPFLRFRLDRAFAAADLGSPEGRARAAERALAIVAEHPTDLVRDQYLMDVAGRCRLDPERLRPTLDRLVADQGRRARSGGGRPGGPGSGRTGRAGAAGGSGRLDRAGLRGGNGRSDRGGPAPGSQWPGGGGPAGGGNWSDGGGAPGGDDRSDRRSPPGGGDRSDRGGPMGGSGRSDRGGQRGGGDWSDRGGAPGWSGPPGADGSRPVANEPPPTLLGGPGDLGGGGGRGAGAGRNGRQVDGPAVEVLRHAVHNRAEVQPWLHAELFADPLHRDVLQALADAPTVADAVATSPPAVADLLARLVAEEPRSEEPFHAVRLLLLDVAQRELRELSLTTASVGDPAADLAATALLHRCSRDLAPDQRDAETSVVAANRLLAWLRQRVGDGG